MTRSYLPRRKKCGRTRRSRTSTSVSHAPCSPTQTFLVAHLHTDPHHMASEGGKRQQPGRLRPRLPAEGPELTEGRRDIFGTKRRGTCRLISFSCFLFLLPHVWANPTAVSPQNAPIAGRSTITILGGPGAFGKGPSNLKVRMGGSAASSTTWRSETSILASLPVGKHLAFASERHDDIFCFETIRSGHTDRTSFRTTY